MPWYLCDVNTSYKYNAIFMSVIDVAKSAFSMELPTYKDMNAVK